MNNTHAIEFYQMARLEGLDLYAPLEESFLDMMFQQLFNTEYGRLVRI